MTKTWEIIQSITQEISVLSDRLHNREMDAQFFDKLVDGYRQMLLPEGERLTLYLYGEACIERDNALDDVKNIRGNIQKRLQQIKILTNN